MDLAATADGGTTVETIDQTRTYELSHAYPVSQTTLFNAFLNAAVLKDIWGVSSITVDATLGGLARAKLTVDGVNWDFTLTYQELIRPDKLRWIVHFDHFPSKEARATLSFLATAAGSAVTVRMENFETSEDRDANRQAWEAGLKKLEAILGGRNAAGEAVAQI
jgi:uncharacterized protein YndB with AHSA1/START domain